tara:strand:+ start:127 stop:375 length:249 start_codon:yes stop_codon:yes gene_type:complete
MPLGYSIFRNNEDEQREAMVSQQTYANEGITWHLRIMRWKYIGYTALWSTATGCVVAITDYSINLFTDYNGILGWLITGVFG